MIVLFSEFMPFVITSYSIHYTKLYDIALVIFMTIHMVVVHYPPFHIDFGRIVDRLAQPLWKGIDIAFLFFVLLHALTGAYAVLMDLEKSYNFV